MNGQQREFGGAIPLGSVKPMMPEIVTHVAAQVSVIEGGDGLGDATHRLQIELPLKAMAVRIPMNAKACRELGRQLSKAGGIAQPARDESEGE